jgi:hypothetical protein
VSITSGTRVDVAPHDGQANVISSMNGRCGSTSRTSWSASADSSVSEPTAVS